MTYERFFGQEVNTDSREDMVRFLTDHFRYYTMSSVNRSTSYAQKVKIYDLGLTEEEEDKAFDILFNEDVDASDFHIDISNVFRGFQEQWNYKWGIDFNGRLNGYLVLYKTELKENDNIAWYPGREIDQYEDFEEFTDQELGERVELVQDFDRACDEVRDVLVDWINNSEIVEVEKEIVVTEKVLTKK